MLIMRQALGQGLDIGARDAKGRKANKDKPDAEVTCYHCSKMGHRKPDCWSWQAAKEEKRKQPAKKDAARPERREEGSECRGRRIARGWPPERQCERIPDAVG